MHTLLLLSTIEFHDDKFQWPCFLFHDLAFHDLELTLKWLLQVRTRLQNPTRYHVQQKQQLQMQQYLSEANMAAATVQSLPSDLQTTQIQTNQNTLVGSAPTIGDPDSPLSVGMSSTATSVSEVLSKWPTPIECTWFKITAHPTTLVPDIETLPRNSRVYSAHLSLHCSHGQIWHWICHDFHESFDYRLSALIVSLLANHPLTAALPD